MKSVWAILVPLFLMALSVGDARYYESDDYLQVFRPKKTESSSYIRFGKRGVHPHTGAKRDQEEEEEDYLKLLQANRDRRGAESSYIRFGKRSSLLAPYNVKSYSCILEQVLKAKSEEELKQLLQNNDCLRLY